MAKQRDANKTIWVRSARDDNRVAAHEVDPAHPGGSIMVAGDLVVEAAPTAFVEAQIRAEALEEVTDSKDIEAARKRREEIREANAITGTAAPGLAVAPVGEQPPVGDLSRPINEPNGDDDQAPVSYDKQTNERLKAELANRGIEFDADAVKRDLVALLEDDDRARDEE
jgi:hypothetical protein